MKLYDHKSYRKTLWPGLVTELNMMAELGPLTSHEEGSG